MRPISVKAGENAPDVDDLMEKAKNMEELLAKNERLMNNSQMKNITGVEEAPMTHYWTNQNQPSEDIEAVTNKGTSSESVSLIDANPHQTGSTLSAHENSSGGDVDPSGESTARYGAGSSGVRKSVAVTKGPLEALLGGAGGGGPKPPMGGPPMGGDKPPMGGDKPPMGPPKLDLDDGDDADALGEKIKALVDDLVEMSDDGKPKLPMPKPPMPGGGPPGMGAGPPPGGPPGLGGGGPPPMM